jgi:O-succinylbenzoate synthase
MGGMRVRLEHKAYALPFRTPVNTAHGPWAIREGVLLRVSEAEGRVAYAESAPIPWFGTETPAAALELLKGLGEQFETAELAQLPCGHPCTVGALRRAVGQLAGGGLPAPEPGTALRCAALLPAGRPARTRLREQAEAGFRCFKWKVGVLDADDELAMLDDLLSELPSGAQLRLDANGAWDGRRAARWLERCSGLPIEFIEQPVAPDARGAEDLLLGLASDFPVTLALDESIVADEQIARWLGLGWPGVLVVKPSLLGDPLARLEELHRAGARVVFSSALETRVGALHALQAAFAWRGQPRALGFGVWPLFADARLDGPRSAPFVRAEDLGLLNPEDAWNAAS